MQRRAPRLQPSWQPLRHVPCGPTVVLQYLRASLVLCHPSSDDVICFVAINPAKISASHMPHPTMLLVCASHIPPPQRSACTHHPRFSPRLGAKAPAHPAMLLLCACVFLRRCDCSDVPREAGQLSRRKAPLLATGSTDFRRALLLLLRMRLPRLAHRTVTSRRPTLRRVQYPVPPLRVAAQSWMSPTSTFRRWECKTTGSRLECPLSPPRHGHGLECA